MKKIYCCIISLILLLVTAPVFAQNNRIGLNWQKCLGGAGNDELTKLHTLPNGDVLVLGTTTSNDGDVSGNHGAEDIWVARINANAQLVWQRCIGGSAKDSAVNMLTTSDGGVLISGITFSADGDATGNHGQRDALVARLDANGNLLWTRCLGGSANEILIRMAAVGASGFTLFGETTSNNGDVSGNHGGADLWVIHLNGAGASVWQRCYGGSLNETASDFRYLPQHNAYLLLGKPGSVNGDLTTSHKDRVAWLMKTDLAGTITAQAVGGFANPFSVANGNKYAVGGLVQDNSLYGFTYTEEVNFAIGFSSSRMHAIAFLCRFNPATMPGFTDYYTAGLNIKLNEQPSEYTNETDGSKGIVGLKGRTGGGFLMLEDYEGCYFMDNYGWAFAMNTAKSGLTTGRFNAAGYRPDGIAKVRAICNNTFYPNQVTRGNYFSGDAYMPDENQFVSGGRTTDLDRNPNYGGTFDAFLAYGSFASFFGGSGNEGFTNLSRIDNTNFYAGGFTTSNNGQVSGNHGGDEIWLVNARLRNNTIKGTAYVDLNGNGTKDATEPWATGYMVSSRNNFIDVESGLQQGKFINQVGTGAFTSSLMNLPAYFTAVPPSINTNFSGLDNTDSIGFALKPVQNFNDLAVDFIAQNVARPGFTTSYRIIYKNYGTQAANGVTLSFVKDNRLTLLSSSLGGYTTIGDTLRWSLGNLNFMQEGVIDLNLQVAAPPVVNIGDTLRSKIMIDPMNGDISPSNNTMALNQRVQGSFDPNDKLENHAGSIRRAKALAGEELVYTIRFQNTGTDTAFNVYIRDTLPTRLDASSLRVISASHAYTVESSGFVGFGYQQVLTFRFNNILLPDSGTNAAASNGFISFAIKTVNSITVGNQVLNSASIYFDFNASVSTNTVKTVIDGVPKPQVFVENGFCYNAGLQTGKVLNPGGYAVSVSLDNIPLVYNQADSTFSFNVTGLATNIPHPLKVVFTYDPNEKDSLIKPIYVYVPPLTTIFLGDTTLCQGAAPLLLLGSVERWRIMYPSGASLCQGACYFNPQLAGPGTHLVIGEKDSHFPCYTTTYDTLRITVANVPPPVIYNNDTTVCVLSSPLALSSNIPVIWSGAGVAGNTFTPSIAGPGTHKIIATKTNAGCPNGTDTLTIVVNGFIQAVITNPNQTVCKLSTPINLQANTTVSWTGNGVTGSTFNPSVAGAGVHNIIATKTNGTCPDSKDTINITVEDFVQAVISNPDATMCKLSSPINLTANTTVSWSGNGVAGSTFNPSVAGAGVHRIIATKTNGTCPDSKDTLTITVDDFVQAVIANTDATVCKLSSPINLQANTNVTWLGSGVSGSTFNPAAAGVGTHQIIATKTNGTCPDSKDTITITVDDFVQTVITNPDATVCKLSSPINLQANTTVSWNGAGVAGTTFNPSIAGAGVHKIIATKTNGTCPDSKDTLTITVDDFVQAVITNPDATVCKLSSPINLQANTAVSWAGNGVSGTSFNPAVAGSGVHKIIATKTNGICPDSKDTLTITVDDFVQAVITNLDATVCKLSSPIALQANTTVSWNGAGVAGTTFNPSVAGVGVHKIIATKTNGTCPDSKDTLTITVDDFVQAVISTPNQTICISVPPIALQANTTVSWVGTGVSGSTFNPLVAGAGTHQIIATKTNGACPDSKDTLLITVNALLTPDVTITASQNTINSANSFSDLVATNATGGGSSPLYIFAKDRNFTQVLQAESASNTYRVLPQMLTAGANTIYVRMRSSENCVTSTTAIDSVQLTLLVSTPSKSELEKALKVFPNPNNGQFGFRFETGINDRVLVTVYDGIGKQVFKQDYGQVQQFNFGKTLDLRNRHAGRYTVQLRIGSIVITKKVNVMR